MNKKRASFAIAAVIFLGSLKGLLTAAQTTPDYSILWSDDAHTIAAFVSGSALEAVANRPVDEVMRVTSLSALSAAEVKTYLDIDLRVTKEGLARGETCMRHPQGFGFGPIAAPKSLSFADIVQKEAVAVVGTVERATVGLSVHPPETATYAILRVSEVLRDINHVIRLGQTVSFLQRGGTISYKGVPICTDSGGMHVPAVGDHLLLVGVNGYGETIAGKLVPNWLFLVESGEVIPNSAYTLLADTAAKPLTQLRAELAEKAAGQ
jgi:hypothetical protein